MNVTTNGKFSQKPRCHRVEGFHRRKDIQTFLRHPTWILDTRLPQNKLLHITHSQQVFRNFTLHDKQKGWSRRKELSETIENRDKRREIDVDNIPESSRFLLEMDYDNLMKSNIHNKMYWVAATKAAIKTSQRKATHLVRKRIQLY